MEDENIGLAEPAGDTSDGEAPPLETSDEETGSEPSTESKPTEGEPGAPEAESTPSLEAPKTVPLSTLLERVSRAKEQTRRARAEAETARLDAVKYQKAVALLQRELEAERAARSQIDGYDPRDHEIADLRLRSEFDSLVRETDGERARKLAELEREAPVESETEKLQLEYDVALEQFGDLVSFQDLNAEMLRLANSGVNPPHAALVAAKLHKQRLAAALKRAGVQPQAQKPAAPAKQTTKAPPVGASRRSPRLHYTLDNEGMAQRMQELVAAAQASKRKR